MVYTPSFRVRTDARDDDLRDATAREDADDPEVAVGVRADRATVGRGEREVTRRFPGVIDLEVGEVWSAADDRVEHVELWERRGQY